MKFTPQINWMFLMTCIFYTANGATLGAETSSPLNDYNPILPVYYADFDGDGYGDPFNFLVAPEAPDGFVNNNDDCNDEAFFINPGISEICNNYDDNCNTDIDEGLTFTIYYADEDGDTYGSPEVFINSCQPTPPPGYSNDFTDCNDFYFFANPGASETCNGVDDNCDGNIDEGVIVLFYVDSDGDGYGNPDITLLACTPPPNYILDNTDCNDSEFFINPGAAEICNGIDDNCNAMSDEGLAFYNYFADFDADNFGNPGFIIITCSEIIPDGYTLDNTDCNDSDMNIYPGAVEICNFTDDNCDFLIDEGLPVFTYYADLDGDEYGNIADIIVTCVDGAIPGYVSDSTDCIDTDININPSAIEICNLIDDDCDGATDEDLLMHTYFADADNDDYGDPDADDIFCNVIPPEGYVYDNTDCDDTNPNIYPGSTEIANGLDDDCDQLIDEGIVAISDEDLSDNFIISPNPNSGSFIINYNFPANISGNNYSITIINTSGEMVYSKNLLNTNTKSFELINLDNLSAGIYFLELNDGNKICIKKIVITD